MQRKMLRLALAASAVGALWLVFAGAALAQQSVAPCVTGTAPAGSLGSAPCSPVTVTNPLPTASQAAAQSPVVGSQYGLTVASATSLTVPVGATHAQVVVEGQTVRCTVDGATTPTASVGTLYPIGAFINIWGATALKQFQCIQTGATATLDVEYSK